MIPIHWRITTGLSYNVAIVLLASYLYLWVMIYTVEKERGDLEGIRCKLRNSFYKTKLSRISPHKRNPVQNWLCGRYSKITVADRREEGHYGKVQDASLRWGGGVGGDVLTLGLDWVKWGGLTPTQQAGPKMPSKVNVCKKLVISSLRTVQSVQSIM